MCGDHRWVQAATGHQLHQLRDRPSIDKTCGDRYVASPELLEVKRGGVAVHPDVRDPSTRADQVGCELERVRYPHCLERDIDAESVGELHDQCEGVLAPVVDRDVGSEVPGALEAAV